MKSIIEHFVRQCMDVDCQPPYLYPIIAATLRKLGFKAFIFSSQWASNFRELQGHFDRLLLDATIKDRAYLSDPIMKGALNSWTPVFWDAEQYCNSEQPFAPMFERSLSVGYERGVAARTGGRTGEIGILVAVYDGRRDCMYEDRALLSSALTVTASYAALAWSGKEELEPDAVQLTPRELECLRWSFQGKTAWEISRIISCSERTVNFHLQNAMRKLGVASKQQAVFKALKLGMISAWQP